MNEFIKILIPRIKKVNDAIDFNIISGTKFEIDPPANAPIKLAKTRAVEEPKKTANGLLDVPLIVKVANCVLSPSSAINIVRNVDKIKLKIIYMKGLIMSYPKNKLIIIINKPVKKANLLGEILFDSHLPIKTPTRLELINAIELPIKTIIGLPDSADNIRVAI